MAAHLKRLFTAQGVENIYAHKYDEGVKSDVRGKILSTGKDAGKVKYRGDVLSPSDFVKKATGKAVARKDVSKNLFIHSDEHEVSLNEWIDENAPEATPGAMLSSVQKVLEELNLSSIKNLHTASHGDGANALPARLFRVLRPDEVNALTSRGLMARGGLPDKLDEFCMDIFNHVMHGTGTVVKQPKPSSFVSTTSDLACAAWWSAAFVQPVVVVHTPNLKRLCPDARLWQPTNDTLLEMFKSNKWYEHTAVKSREFLIEAAAPAEAVELYQPTRDVRRAAQYPDDSKDRFPDSFDNLVFEKNLGGCSAAIKVKCKVTGREFVLKRGAQKSSLPRISKLKTVASHVIAEFFTFAFYGLCGAPIPGAALYHVRIHEPTGDLMMWVLLTEFIEGSKLDMSWNLSVQNAREWAWLDIALGNFDVAGIAFSNLVCRPNESAVYRIDCGCNVSFGANGDPRTFSPLDRAELDVFKDADSQKSTKLSSKCSVASVSQRSPMSSGAARYKLFFSALGDRSLANRMAGIELDMLQRKVIDWIWRQPQPQAHWSDMADVVFERARMLRVIVCNLPEET